jgi:DNA-binding NarL/FixJ family response regulator
MEPTSQAVRVMMVDDDDLVGQIVRITLKHAGGFEWMGQVRDIAELEETIDDPHPDVVLLDLCMPGNSPFVALDELRRKHPEARIVIFSARCGQSLVDRAIEAGAWGYISKDNDGWGVISAIRRVANGEFVVSQDVRAECALLA